MLARAAVLLKTSAHQAARQARAAGGLHLNIFSYYLFVFIFLTVFCILENDTPATGSPSACWKNDRAPAWRRAITPSPGGRSQSRRTVERSRINWPLSVESRRFAEANRTV